MLDGCGCRLKDRWWANNLTIWGQVCQEAKAAQATA
jgi:hypothetical protein